jgi:lysophospholipase L1-like esterase
MISETSLRTALGAALLLLVGLACGASAPEPPRDVVVFLGDSLVDDGPWKEAFPDVELVNLGVGGDRVMDVFARLDELADPRMHVVKLFLLIGTNDARDQMPGRELAGRYLLLVRRLREMLPDARIHLITLPPCGPHRNEIVLTLNDAIREAAAAQQLSHTDLYPEFATADGSLRAEYDLDGVHLNKAGYRRWVELIAPHVNGDAGKRPEPGDPAPGAR